MIPSRVGLRILNPRLRSDRDTGSQTLPPDASQTDCSSCGETSQTQPRILNVVICGEPGVGKSSVVNLIARTEIAQVSSNVLVNGCTMQYNRYPVSFDDMNFAIFDTIGLEESQMGVNNYLEAIERAYELIIKLGTTGGIHLLLFCVRGGKITATTLSNYRLFCECLCHTKVPIALVFTGLKRETTMEDWWNRNKKRIEDYGIKSDDHACITAVQNDSPGEYHNYKESEERIRKVLKNCARKNEGFSPESHPWFARVMRGMKSLVVGKKNPKKKDIMKILTHRCKMDLVAAKKIATMMENGEADNLPTGNGEGEGGNIDPEDMVQGRRGPSPNEHDVQAAPAVVPNKEGDIMRSDVGRIGGKLVAQSGRDSDQPVNPASDSNVEGTVQGGGSREDTSPDDQAVPVVVPNKVEGTLRSNAGRIGGKLVAQIERDGEQTVNLLSNVESTVDGGDTSPNTHHVQAVPDVVPNNVDCIRRKPVAQSGRDGDREAVDFLSNVKAVRGGRDGTDTSPNMDKHIVHVQAAPGVPSGVTSTVGHIGRKPMAQSGNDSGDRALAMGAQATTKLSSENSNFTIFFFALVCAVIVLFLKAQGCFKF